MTPTLIGFLLVPATMWTGWIIRAWLDGTLKLKVKFPHNIRASIELAAHIIAGSALFALVFSAAAALNFLIDFFVKYHFAPNWLVEPTHVLEAVVWAGDSIAFLIFTLVQLFNFCVDIIFQKDRGLNGAHGIISHEASRSIPYGDKMIAGRNKSWANEPDQV